MMGTESVAQIANAATEAPYQDACGQISNGQREWHILLLGRRSLPRLPTRIL